MNILSRLCCKRKKTYSLNDVFTPSTAASLCYVERKGLEDDLKRSLSVHGKQIIIYGYSGSGKTTLLTNKLKELNQGYIKTHCESTTTFDALILQAFDALDIYYIDEKKTSSSQSCNASITAEYKLIKSNLGADIRVGQENNSVRCVPMQLTPQKLASFMGSAKQFWVIEDFHKVNEYEKQRIADVIKIFVDCANENPDTKIICVGAVQTARELIELNDNLIARVSQCNVPLLGDDELTALIKKGMDLLNVEIEERTVQNILHYSHNLASSVHQMCYDICYGKGITKTVRKPQKIEDKEFERVLTKSISDQDDTFNQIYDSINNANKYGWYILKTFEKSEMEFLSCDDILYWVNRKRDHDKKIKHETLGLFLDKLCTGEYKHVLTYDQTSKKYFLSKPQFGAFLKRKIETESNEQLNRKNKIKRRNKDKSTLLATPDKNLAVEDYVKIRFEDIFSKYYKELDGYQSNSRIKNK